MLGISQSKPGRSSYCSEASVTFRFALLCSELIAFCCLQAVQRTSHRAPAQRPCSPTRKQQTPGWVCSHNPLECLASKLPAQGVLTPPCACCRVHGYKGVSISSCSLSQRATLTQRTPQMWNADMQPTAAYWDPPCFPSEDLSFVCRQSGAARSQAPAVLFSCTGGNLQSRDRVLLLQLRQHALRRPHLIQAMTLTSHFWRGKALLAQTLPCLAQLSIRPAVLQTLRHSC